MGGLSARVEAVNYLELSEHGINGKGRLTIIVGAGHIMLVGEYVPRIIGS
jgi:hypothetical protein